MSPVDQDAPQESQLPAGVLEGGSLAEIVHSAGLRFALVGNGAGDLERGRGETVDSADVVFRFNNYHLDHPKDYGERFDPSRDVWVNNGFGDVAQRPGWTGKVVCPRPIEVPRYRLQHRRAKFKNMGVEEGEIETIPVDIWTLLINRWIYHKLRIGRLDFWAENKGVMFPYAYVGELSSGAALAFWIVQLTGRRLERDQFVGFSFFEEGEPHHYGDAQDWTVCDGAFERLFFEEEIWIS